MIEDKNPVRSKLDFTGERVIISAEEALSILREIFSFLNCPNDIGEQVAFHLVDTSLCGIESHGVMRVLQYAEQMQSGYMKSDGIPAIKVNSNGAHYVDGNGGVGIPAMVMAYDKGVALAESSGLSVVAIKNVGHTGRHGAFADIAAEKGFLTICIGGGNRKTWRQVAPYGGAKAMLPTNPWCIGIPGGERGPVVLDFATSKIAGGWIYAARSAGALLPNDCVIDNQGNVTRDPEDYFNGGAILPSGGHKGYGLALIAELIADAMLGREKGEAAWLLLTLDATRYNEESKISLIAEEILEEIRSCPPAPGFEQVDVPGERERGYRRKSNGEIAVPQATWRQITDLRNSLASKTK